MTRKKGSFLELLLSRAENPPKQKFLVLSLSEINIVDQPRNKFSKESLEAMGRNIKTLGQINPIDVAKFNSEQAQEYLLLVNDIWNTNWSISDLAPVEEKGQVRYLILIAGERRYRSCEMQGITTIKASLYYKYFSPQQAFMMQLAENIHVKPPIAREAKAIAGIFRMLSQMFPSQVTKKEFGDQIGRSAREILNCIRFAELPFEVQKAVEDERIKFGVALEFYRLWKKHSTNQKLVRLLGGIDVVKEWFVNYLTEVIGQKLTAKGFHEMAEKKISDTLIGQMEFQLEVQTCHKTVFAKNLLPSTLAEITYLREVLGFFREGKMKAGESPFLEKEFRVHYQQMVELFKDLIPHLKFVTEALKKKDLNLVQQVNNLLTEIDLLLV